MIPFAEWTPDVADLGGQGASIASGVFPAANGYLPWPSPVVYSSPCEVMPAGAVTAFVGEGVRYVFCGSEEKLFKLNASTRAFEDVSKTATTYALADGDTWDFAQFGNSLIAVNVNDDTQVFDLAAGTAFDDLAGSPPRAKYIEIVGDFVMLGYLDGYPQRVQWSGINNSAFWTPGVNQSDYQDFPDGGPVVGVIGGTGGLILQEEMIRRSSYVGPPAIFQFDKIADRGLLAPFSLVRIGNVAYGISRDGFIQVSIDGQFNMPGKEKVDRWFLNDADPTSLKNARGAADRFLTKIYWVYRSRSAVAAGFDSIICFDYAINRWTLARVDCIDILPAATPGYSLDDLDALGFTLETLPASLDDPMYTGGSPVIGIIDTSFRLCFMSGSPMEAVIDSVEAEPGQGRRSVVSGVRPLVDTTAAVVSIGHRTLQSDAVVFSDEAAIETTTGLAPFEIDDRYHRWRVRIPAGTTWTKALGVDIVAGPSGEA